MLKKIVIIIFISFLSPCFSMADQAAWVEKEYAYKAGQMIEIGSEIRLFCAPCGDKVWTSMIVTKTEVKNTSDSFYQVFLNGEGIDLAYAYIPWEGKWRNLALALKLPVSDVPEFLADGMAHRSEMQEEHPLDRELSACMDMDPSTADMVNCIYGITEKWDAELNLIYQELRTRLTPEGQKALKESQLAWIKYRDLEFKNINELYKNFQGTMFMPMQAEDRMEIIRNRVSELRSYISLFEMEN